MAGGELFKINVLFESFTMNMYLSMVLFVQLKTRVTADISSLIQKSNQSRKNN